MMGRSTGGAGRSSRSRGGGGSVGGVSAVSDTGTSVGSLSTTQKNSFKSEASKAGFNVEFSNRFGGAIQFITGKSPSGRNIGYTTTNANEAASIIRKTSQGKRIAKNFGIN